jgi:hypothetical protein
LEFYFHPPRATWCKLGRGEKGLRKGKGRGRKRRGKEGKK